MTFEAVEVEEVDGDNEGGNAVEEEEEDVGLV